MARVVLFALITHSVLGGVGHAHPGQFLNLKHMRVLLRPSETTITTQILWQLDCNSGDSSYGRFSAADLSALCLQDMKQ